MAKLPGTVFTFRAIDNLTRLLGGSRHQICQRSSKKSDSAAVGESLAQDACEETHCKAPKPHDKMHFTKALSKWPCPSSTGPVPAYRILSPTGKLLHPGGRHGSTSDGVKFDPYLDELLQDHKKCLDIYKAMVMSHHLDHILYNAQRQGRISFYMTNFGEEATVIGSAAALDISDPIFAQYREVGALLYRGFGLNNIMNQVMGNIHDLGKGRQMPVHYGSKDLNYFTISSPLATQIPQASGAAYAVKNYNSQNSESKRTIACYFGEGAASEGDFHAGLNFAATLKCPVVFICRNNGYAISTPIQDQYTGDGIGSRGPGYGIQHTYRVDGNDVFAVYEAVARARQIAINDNVPVLIEAITYRVGHHSTSDDSTIYRSKEEVDSWVEQTDPILRLKTWLCENGAWNEEQDVKLVEEIKNQVRETFHAASKFKRPSIDEMFTDVYDVIPWHLQEQKEELERLLQKYPDSSSHQHWAEHHK
jgi:2-oxoisovalerate dehydrogenase E1 component alpha subunit